MWKICLTCGMGYKPRNKVEEERCPYCGSRYVKPIRAEELELLEVAYEEPKMIQHIISIPENIDKILREIGDNVKWKRRLRLPAGLAETQTTYKLALMNAIATRDPRLWRLVEDIKRINEE